MSRKATHTDPYLQWTSNHHIHEKRGFVRTLMHCTETLIRDESRVNTRKEKVRVTLRNCGYSEWAFKAGGTTGKKTEEEGRRNGWAWREGQTGGEI